LDLLGVDSSIHQHSGFLQHTDVDFLNHTGTLQQTARLYKCGKIELIKNRMYLLHQAFDFQEADVARPDSRANQTIYLKAQSIKNLPSQQHYRPLASNLQVVCVGQEGQQLESVLELVPKSIPVQPQQQQPSINETVNFKLQLNNNKPVGKDPKKTKTSTAQAPK
jgi:hypothetical protein